MAWLRELWTTGRSTVALGLAVAAMILALFAVVRQPPDRYQLIPRNGTLVRLDRATGELVAYRLYSVEGFKKLASTNDLDAPPLLLDAWTLLLVAGVSAVLAAVVFGAAIAAWRAFQRSRIPIP